MKYDYAGAIRSQLMQEIRNGRFADCDRLPRETELAEQFGVSRTHLRDVLAQLEREGYITRRHGVGTLINRHVFQVKNRMDIETEFLDIIRLNGHEADLLEAKSWEAKATAKEAEKLRIPEGFDVLHVSRVCAADGRPAIYCEDVLDKRLIKQKFTQDDVDEPIFHLLKKACDTYAYMDLTRLRAVAVGEDVAGILQIPVGTPILNMEEIDYDIDGNIIFYSNQYFADEFFEHTVLRKKL